MIADLWEGNGIETKIDDDVVWIDCICDVLCMVSDRYGILRCLKHTCKLELGRYLL